MMRLVFGLNSILIILVLLLSGSLLAAQDLDREDYSQVVLKNAVGIRAGIAADPDQVLIGVQAVVGKVTGALKFVPGADIGYGDDMMLMALNGDFRLPLMIFFEHKLAAYVGGGPTLAFLNPEDAESVVEPGLSLIGGILFDIGRGTIFDLQARFGIGDIGEFKMFLGVMF